MSEETEKRSLLDLQCEALEEQRRAAVLAQETLRKQLELVQGDIAKAGAYLAELQHVQAYREREDRERPTLRDHFAIAALPEVLRESWGSASEEEIANGAYQIAEAMLVERAKVTP